MILNNKDIRIVKDQVKIIFIKDKDHKFIINFINI